MHFKTLSCINLIHLVLSKQSKSNLVEKLQVMMAIFLPFMKKLLIYSWTLPNLMIYDPIFSGEKV